MHEILLTHYQALLPRQRSTTLCLGTAGSFGTETLRIIPGAGWKGLTISATFHPTDGAPVRMLVPADGILQVPAQVMAVSAEQEAPAVIVFTGTAEDIQRISADLPYTVLDHASIEGEAPVPTENEWQQLTAAYASKVDKQQGIEHSGKVLGIDEQGNVIPMAYIPGGGAAGSSAPADWSINDPEMPGYIHHRTHWLEESYGVIASETIQPEGNAYLAEGSWPLAAGETYQVTWDGTDYPCVCYETTMEEMSLLVLGNPMFFGSEENTGEPFAVGVLVGMNNIFCFAADDTPHTLIIQGLSRVYHKLSPEFLPPMVGENTTGREYEYNGNSYIGGMMAEAFNSRQNIAAGDYSHAEGMETAALGLCSHAEGYQTCAEGDYSHAEGTGTSATGFAAHAEGWGTVASNLYAHAEGYGTIAQGSYQHVEGRYNQAQSQYAHILGGGTGENDRKNLHTIDWRGNAWFSGNLRLSGHPILTAADGTQYMLKVNADGTLFTEAYTG